MRKFALLIAAAVAAVGGSSVKADFVVGHTRAANAVTIGGNAYDVVTWTVSNNGANNTGFNLASIEAAFVAPQSGMSIGLRGTNRPDVYGTGAEPNKTLDSFLTTTLSGGASAPGESVLNKSGGNYTVDTALGTTFTGTYPSQQMLVAGIGGALLFTSPPDANPADSANFGAAVTFAQIVVPAGQAVVLLAPSDKATTYGVPATFRPLGTAFGEDPNDANGIGGHTAGALLPLSASIVDGTLPVPEPGTLTILGMVGAGLMARRRKA